LFLTTHAYTVLILPPQWNKLTIDETISLNSWQPNFKLLWLHCC